VIQPDFSGKNNKYKGLRLGFRVGAHGPNPLQGDGRGV